MKIKVSFILFYFTICLHGQEKFNINITDSNYSKELTKSNKDIKISSSILHSSNIKFEITSNSGRIELNPGFSSDPSKNGSFTAQIVPNNYSPKLIKKIVIYPNPAKTYFQINLNDYKDVFKIKIFNSIGINVYQNNNYNKGQVISIGNLISGFYFIEISFNGEIYREKLIKK
jgi:hypothetical protein